MDKIKVFYQAEGTQKLIIEDYDTFISMIEEEMRAELEIYTNEPLNDEQKQQLEKHIEELKSLEPEQEFEACGFEWGVTEMTREEIDRLPEFSGW